MFGLHEVNRASLRKSRRERRGLGNSPSAILPTGECRSSRGSIDLFIVLLLLSRQDRTIRDRPEYEEIEKIIRETEERAFVIEKTDADQARRIREKITRLRECLENLKSRSTLQPNNEEIVRYNERYEERIRTTDRTAPRERVRLSTRFLDIDLKER